MGQRARWTHGMADMAAGSEAYVSRGLWLARRRPGSGNVQL